MKACLLLLTLFGMSVAAPAAAASADDAAINRVYSLLASRRAANDAAGMASAFAPQGLLVDARPGPAIAGGELEARLRPMAERVTADRLTIRTAYRVERRSVMGDVAVDAGYMRQAVARPEGQPNVRYSRFLVTLRRGADGAWRIIGDASMPSTEEVWSALPRTEGLQFDA